ncbi:MAG: N-acetylmuramoyl-L-alanine amidase [Micavibrio sp.]|nr:N-acetylmuramoyl-L-alanine amidase [Micavibrio sp.]MBK9562958.1 N-acetylmuramoyl-L-alanine amidase [Micavibrio sp.]
MLLLGIIPGQAHALSVNQVRFGAHPDKIRLVLDLSEKTDFRVFALANPYRMVIDLPDFEWRAGNASTTPSSGVTALRYGNLQPGISRIVFDMAKPVSVRGAFIIPAQKGQPNRLVVDFTHVTEDVFERNKDISHGTLVTSGQVLAAPQAVPSHKPPTPPGAGYKPLIVIDAGHGGVDPGARGVNKTNEKNVTLALAKQLKSELEGTGRYRVALTRDKDIFIKLRERVSIARRQQADLFISIHADSIEKSNVSGVSVYTLSEKASDAQTAKLAAQENRADLIAGLDLSVEDEDVASILVDLAMRDTMNQSNFFANTLIDKLKARQVRLLDSPHRSAGFAVLKAPDIPSVLVEAGFMSNKKESELLNTPAHRAKISQALSGAIDSYFEQVRKNQRI